MNTTKTNKIHHLAKSCWVRSKILKSEFKIKSHEERNTGLNTLGISTQFLYFASQQMSKFYASILKFSFELVCECTTQLFYSTYNFYGVAIGTGVLPLSKVHVSLPISCFKKTITLPTLEGVQRLLHMHTLSAHLDFYFCELSQITSVYEQQQIRSFQCHLSVYQCTLSDLQVFLLEISHCLSNNFQLN